MVVRKAERKDADRINALLFQVQQVHADGRPDIFVGGAKKYTNEELYVIMEDSSRPIYVAVDEEDNVWGYAFCIYEEPTNTENLQPIKTLYIDDLCVDEVARGKHIGSLLYEYVLNTAKKNNCYRVTLNVWCLNETAMRFYEKCGLTPLKITMEKKIND